MAHTPDLRSYDYIVLNTSGGKDSQAMLDYVVGLALAAGVLDRVIAVHADLGRVEWEGTRELAERQAAAYGITRFEVVSRPQGDLLDQIIDRRISLDARGKEATPAFPSSKNRFCTSDQKTSQVEKLFTRLGKEHGAKPGRPVCILNCLGLRAEESDERANKVPFGPDTASNSVKVIDRWLPIHTWSVQDVWETIHASGVEYHRAYDLGMTRLSCVFCVFASKSDLTIAAKHNPALAREYVEVEILTRSQFKGEPGKSGSFSMTDVIAWAEAA